MNDQVSDIEETVNEIKPKAKARRRRKTVTDDQAIGKSLDKLDKIRMATGKQRRLDADYYAAQPKYQDKQLMWVNDMDGEVQKWLQLGASLVPRENKTMREWEGFTDKATSKWECVQGVGVDQGGTPIDAYLLFMDAEEYNEIKIEPLRQRQAEISRSMGMGEASREGNEDLQTYAPELPTGGRGYNQVRGQ